MRPDESISAELGPHVEAEEADGIDVVAERLHAVHPLPRAAFRSSLRARLSELEGKPAWPQARLRAQILSYAGAGSFLLAVAALGLAGVGPLAP